MATLINTRRTINPLTDILSSQSDFNKCNRLIKINKSKSCNGKIQSSINKRPLEKNRKIKNDMTKETGIFTPEFNSSLPVSNHKTFVNLSKIKKRGDYAGSVTQKKDDDFLYKKSSLHHK